MPNLRHTFGRGVIVLKTASFLGRTTVVQFRQSVAVLLSVSLAYLKGETDYPER